ncbi:Putative tyrosine-protein kinase YveL [uncultured bacterium]|nr:Putative tyrosine-protein kinase YveL [uncultured bacterium]
MEHKKEKTYYEILEVNSKAPMSEIEQAYRKSKSLYGGDSMALYSLYTPEERQDKLKQLEDILETLTDPVKRKSYDQYIGSLSAAPAAEKSPQLKEAARDVFDEYNEAGAFRDRISFKKQLPIMEGKDAMICERYRILYTRLEQISSKKAFKSFAVTSAVKGEGKTTTSLNLAWLMANEFGKKVLLIESDFRNPSISSNYISMGRLSGLVDVINGEADIRSAINRFEDTRLYLLPARTSVKNSSMLVDSQGMKNVLERAKSDFDYVIVDSPPILPLVDMNILSKMVDGLLLVVKAGSTPKDLVRKAVNSLPNKNVSGVVLNGADDNHMKKYYY